MDEQTTVMAEGRRMMRLSRELSREHFQALLDEYQRLLTGLFEGRGGRDAEASGDTATAVFATAKDAALAAVAAQHAMAAHDWPQGPRPAISVALDSGQAAAERCAELCDAAEGGQIFVSQATASLLEDTDLGDLLLCDLGEQQTRRTELAVRAFELVVPPATRW